MLDGKRLLITGVLTRGSIAFEVARQAQEHGARDRPDGLRPRHAPDRARRRATCPTPPDVLELDVNEPDRPRRASRRSCDRAGAASTASCTRSRSRPPTRSAAASSTRPASSAITAFETSAFSLKALAAALAPLLEARRRRRSSASTSTPASPGRSYDWMGVAKAALESVSRYLARDLGPRGIRVNLVSAGPIETIAAGGIPGFDELARPLARRRSARLGHARRGAVAGAVCFLLSDRARAITGEILHVDGGFHAMGAPLR